MSKALALQEGAELSRFDFDNPRSMVNLIESDEFRLAIRRALEQAPSLFQMDEPKLEKVRLSTALMNRLRLSFWDEYDRAVFAGEMMQIKNIVARHCDRAHFYDRILKVNWNVAFITLPPRSYELTMRYILDRANRKIEDILNMPLKTPQGKFDYKLAALVLKIQQVADNRVRGAVTQKLQIQQHSTSMNLTPSDFDRLTLQELDAIDTRVQKIISADKTEKLPLSSPPERVEVLTLESEDTESGDQA